MAKKQNRITQYSSIGLVRTDYQTIKDYCHKHNLIMGGWIAKLALNEVAKVEAATK